MKGRAHSSSSAALVCPNSKEVPIYFWVDRESFPVVAWRSPASNSKLNQSKRETRGEQILFVTLLHSGQPKLHRVLAVLSAVGLKSMSNEKTFRHGRETDARVL